MDPSTPRPSSGSYLRPQLERAIAARWALWVPWVRMQQLRARDYDRSIAAAESDRLQRHSEHILNLMREGISMRTIRRHRLDDPRITDEVRALLVEAAKERQLKAWFRRLDDQRAEGRLATLIKLGPIARKVAASNVGDESTEVPAPAAAVVLDPPALKAAIQTIRRHVCEHFYMREMPDPELQVRTNRRTYVLPRQLTMYIVRQLTGASLEEIGREFGGRHHTTVLHSINRIETMQSFDEPLSRTITRFVDSFVAQT